MDVDPLADTVPPRHAIESDDEEDEFNPFPPGNRTKVPQVVDIKTDGTISSGRKLVVAVGSAGKTWATGASLGEQVGRVIVNGVQFGLVYTPEWTDCVVLVTETTARLPAWAIHQYALHILDKIRPPATVILDTYPAPSYIGSVAVPYYDAPIRYLSTGSMPSIGSHAEPFAPPNLIQGVSASLLSLAMLPSTSPSIATLILLPSPHIPPPPPSALASSDLSLFSDETTWSIETMQEAQQAVFSCLGERDKKWEPGSGHARLRRMAARKKGDIGDGGMYI